MVFIHGSNVLRRLRNVRSSTFKLSSAGKGSSRYYQLGDVSKKTVLDNNEIPAQNLQEPSNGFPQKQSLLQFRTTLNGEDWSISHYGLGKAPFSIDAQRILSQHIDPKDVEIKPEGLLYLPEIRYRRILNKAFGPGGWGLAARGDPIVSEKIVYREYALICLGQLVSTAVGEQDYFETLTIPTALESCKSNALMRCCKDLGIASELWDPRFIREFKEANCVEVWAEHVTSKRKRKIWRRKDQKLSYPFEEK